MATIASKTNSIFKSQSSTFSGDSVQSENTQKVEANLPAGVAKDLVRWFKLLADETRLRILFLLLENGELNVRSLCDMLGLSQPAVSHHLALLRVDGLIECRRDGKHNYYHILPRRFDDLMSKILAAVPGDDAQVQLGRTMLCLTPVDEPAQEAPDVDSDA